VKKVSFPTQIPHYHAKVAQRDISLLRQVKLFVPHALLVAINQLLGKLLVLNVTLACTQILTAQDLVIIVIQAWFQPRVQLLAI